MGKNIFFPISWGLSQPSSSSPNIKDAIRLHIEDRLADGEEIPSDTSVSLSMVEVAIG